MEVINKIKTYQIGTNFKAWICRIAHNLTINGVVKMDKEIPLALSRETEHIFGEAPKKDERIDKALDLLIGDEKEIFVHLIIEGFSVKDTAELMNVNLNRAYYLKKKMEETLRIIIQKY
jgi:RNA polymerase sigma factor (sigma-70 family)